MLSLKLSVCSNECTKSFRRNEQLASEITLMFNGHFHHGDSNCWSEISSIVYFYFCVESYYYVLSHSKVLGNLWICIYAFTSTFCALNIKFLYHVRSYRFNLHFHVEKSDFNYFFPRARVSRRLFNYRFHSNFYRSTIQSDDPILQMIYTHKSLQKITFTASSIRSSWDG